jgi:hypothetical protein
MGTSDFIALLSACIASLAALYARWAATQAAKANAIAVKAELKPRRLSVYGSAKAFFHFCSTYTTMLSLKMMDGTRDLVARIDAFKWEVEQHGPLDMPEFQILVANACQKAWQLQRLIDRLQGPNATPIEKGHDTAEENIDGLIEWFAAKERELKQIFEPYLSIT